MTNITNPYLSAKAVAKKKTDIPVVLVCAIFAAAAVSATITMFSQGKTLSGVMGIFLFAAFITPVFRILRHAYRRACARRIAGALLPLTEESLTFDQLGAVLASSKALEQLRSLIGTGYLQNLQINAAARHAANTAVSHTQNDSQPPGVHDSKKTADFRAKPGIIAQFSSIVNCAQMQTRPPAFPLTSAFYFYTIFKFAPAGNLTALPPASAAAPCGHPPRPPAWASPTVPPHTADSAS